MRVAHFVCTATGLQISHTRMIVFIILRLRLCSLCRSVDKTKTCHRCIRSRFRVRKPKNKKGSDFSKPFDFERKTSHEPAFAGISRELLFTLPNPLTGGTLGSLVASLVFRSKRSLPYQREVWRDCLYSRGLFRETHKKRIAFCYPSCVERKTRLELATPTLARLCSTN